jgi:hypothetical protein
MNGTSNSNSNSNDSHDLIRRYDFMEGIQILLSNHCSYDYIRQLLLNRHIPLATRLHGCDLAFDLGKGARDHYDSDHPLVTILCRTLAELLTDALVHGMVAGAGGNDYCEGAPVYLQARF